MEKKLCPYPGSNLNPTTSSSWRYRLDPFIHFVWISELNGHCWLFYRVSRSCTQCRSSRYRNTLKIPFIGARITADAAGPDASERTCCAACWSPWPSSALLWPSSSLSTSWLLTVSGPESVPLSSGVSRMEIFPLPTHRNGKYFFFI